MADQVEALRWVQKFIKYFGGDKDKVTIVGESAGAASVGFLLLAPQSREESKVDNRVKKIRVINVFNITFGLDLFRYAIAESGSMLADWAVDRNSTKHGYVIAELAGCPLEPYEELLHCLRSIDVITLQNAQSAFSVYFSSVILFTYLSPALELRCVLLLLGQRCTKWWIRFRRAISRYPNGRKN